MVDINLQLPEGFLNEEVRSGYTVTSQRKEVWAIELDLLAQFDKICKENNLSYCVGAGTLLGTIRHHGFIPWDDDIDLYMLRQDYDKLMQLSSKIKNPYFLQNIKTEPNQIKWFARLRNLETTGATANEVEYDICNGIFIDIFPLDGISDNPKQDRLQRKKNTFLRRLCVLYNASKKSTSNLSRSRLIKYYISKCFVALFLRNPEKLYQAYENNLKKYSQNGVELWGNRTLIFDCPKSRRPYKEWVDLIELPFEMLTVPVPREYDSMLRQQYGDYMKFPKNKNNNMHGELLISTDHAHEEMRIL